jgi:AraC family transcriptional regulator
MWKNMEEPGIKAVGCISADSTFTVHNPQYFYLLRVRNEIIMSEISIVDVPPMNVVGIKKNGTYTLIPELLMKVFTYIQKQKTGIAGPPIFVCHETSPAEVKEAIEKGIAVVEVAWPVTGKLKGTKEITTYILPGGRMAHVTHRGPYETCETTYLALFAWIEKQGLTICGPIREVYPNDPCIVPPEEIITDIFVPVR